MVRSGRGNMPLAEEILRMTPLALQWKKANFISANHIWHWHQIGYISSCGNLKAAVTHCTSKHTSNDGRHVCCHGTSFLMQYPCSRSRVLGSAEGWTYLYKICPAPLLAPEVHVTQQQPMGSVHCCFSISHKEWGEQEGRKNPVFKSCTEFLFSDSGCVRNSSKMLEGCFYICTPGLTLPPFWAAPDESSGERKQDKREKKNEFSHAPKWLETT